MTTNRLAELANLAADELNGLCMDLAHGLANRLSEATGELHARSYDGSSWRSAYADPTPSAALRPPDRAARDRADLERLLNRLVAAARAASAIAERYPPAHVAVDADRRALEAMNGTRADGCASCARLRASNGLARWEPPDSRLQGATTVAGRLSEPMVLCSWCRDRVTQWNRLPTLAELEAHHEGRPVRWPSDVDRPA